MAPWSYYRNLYSQVPAHIRTKMSRAYRNYDPSTLDIPLGYYGGRGFISRDRVDGEDKGSFNNIPWDESKVQKKAADYFNRIAEFCRDRNIRLVVRIPLTSSAVPLGKLTNISPSLWTAMAFSTMISMI